MLEEVLLKITSGRPSEVKVTPSRFTLTVVLHCALAQFLLALQVAVRTTVPGRLNFSNPFALTVAISLLFSLYPTEPL